ncbi:MAG: hypothetical protein A2018_01535 [Alphaproteobacteria bacterium GWF2_58_20]|nr:MAG: hypothetical protein A2018_01535 [Alphaproteobacteria bacterium GWF2_58_20]
MLLQDEHIRLLLSGLDSLRVAVVIIDAQETLLYCNQHYKYVYRQSEDPANFLGQSLESLLRHHMAHAEILQPPPEEWLAARMAYQRSGTRYIFEEQLEDGRWIQIRARPVPGQLGTILLLTDASETKSTQATILEQGTRLADAIAELSEKERCLSIMTQDLDIARTDARKAAGARNLFFHNMNHQLRTPLNAIIGFADMMRSEMLGPIGKSRYKEYADDIFQSGSNLLSVINQILDYAQVGSAAYGLNRNLHPVHALIDTCVNNVSEAAAHADIGLDVVGDLEALPHVHVDAIAASQAITNLLLQAIAASPRGGSVYLSVWAENGHVMFAVKDSGHGISDIEIRQLDAMGADEAMKTLRSHAHEGIALPLSKALVGMHGGHFHVESNETAGTTVTFSFPHPEMQAEAIPA